MNDSAGSRLALAVGETSGTDRLKLVRCLRFRVLRVAAEPPTPKTQRGERLSSLTDS